MKLIIISAIWCPSCLIMRPKYMNLSKKYNMEIEDYDYDTDTEIVNKYNLGDILPVCIILNNDIEIKRIIGEKSDKELDKIIEDLI